MGYTRGEAAIMWVVAVVLIVTVILRFAQPDQGRWLDFVVLVAVLLNLAIWQRVQRRQRRGAHRMDEPRTEDPSRP